MAVKAPLYGQSNLDISIEVDNDLDSLVELANNNSIKDLSIIASIYNYDDNKQPKDSIFIGYPYATAYNPLVNICPIPSGLMIVSFGSNFIKIKWNNSFSYYQYSYNTDDHIPTNSEWITTTSSIITLTGLTNGLEYFIFVRSKCNTNLFSKILIITQTLGTTPLENEDTTPLKNEDGSDLFGG